MPLDYRKIPKIELHRHLEGSIRLDTMVELAQDFDLDLPIHTSEALKPLVQVVPSDPHNFVNFLSKFLVLRQFIRSDKIVRRLVEEAVEDAAEDNIYFMELRFTPVALTRISGMTIPEAMQLVSESAAAACEKFGIIVQLVPSVNRHEPLHLAEQVVCTALDMNAANITAVDLAGDEANHPADRFVPLFNQALHSGLDIQIHAGEWAGPENVRQAVEEFHSKRIGHGIRVVDDLAVMKMAKDAGAFFEVCPSSNYLSGAVSGREEHPIKLMLTAGLQTGIFTDDPSICDISLSDEFNKAEEGIGLSQKELMRCMETTAAACSMTESQRQDYLRKLKHAAAVGEEIK